MKVFENFYNFCDPKNFNEKVLCVPYTDTSLLLIAGTLLVLSFLLNNLEI